MDDWNKIYILYFDDNAFNVLKKKKKTETFNNIWNWIRHSL